MYDKYNIRFENKAKIEKIFKILFLIVIQMKSIALTSSYLPSASNSTVFLDSSYTRESFWGDLSTEHQGWFEIPNVRFDRTSHLQKPKPKFDTNTVCDPTILNSDLHFGGTVRTVKTENDCPTTFRTTSATS